MMIIFEPPRGATIEEIYRWALETTDKLNILQSMQEGNSKNGNEER